MIIDNFGTGYASLSYLRNLPVAGLKIDHTFVRDLQADRGNAAIVQAIMTLAGKLGLQVVAEGVETGAEMRALRSFDCDHIQGSFICEPLPLAQLKDFLQTVPKLRQMHQVHEARTADGEAAPAGRNKGARRDPPAARRAADQVQSPTSTPSSASRQFGRSTSGQYLLQVRACEPPAQRPRAAWKAAITSPASFGESKARLCSSIRPCGPTSLK